MLLPHALHFPLCVISSMSAASGLCLWDAPTQAPQGKLASIQLISMESLWWIMKMPGTHKEDPRYDSLIRNFSWELTNYKSKRSIKICEWSGLFYHLKCSWVSMFLDGGRRQEASGSKSQTLFITAWHAVQSFSMQVPVSLAPKSTMDGAWMGVLYKVELYPIQEIFMLGNLLLSQQATNKATLQLRARSYSYPLLETWPIWFKWN